MTTEKLVGRGLANSIRDIVEARVPLNSVLHIESSAMLPNPEQLQNFIRHLAVGGENERAYAISLSLWEADRLIYNRRADGVRKSATWRPATQLEITRNEPPVGSMRIGRVPPQPTRGRKGAPALVSR